MKHLNKPAKLSTNIYPNHSIRATWIGTLDKGGFDTRHITAISSHKSESTIHQYSMKCPESKKREMFNALADSVIPKKCTRPSSTISKPVEANKATGKASSPTISTIDNNQVKSLTNTNTDKNPTEDTLPANFDLVPLEKDNDDILLKILRQ